MFNRLIEGWGPIGPVFVTVTLLSEAVFLFAAAQTGFLSAPRVLSYMSLDRWFPQQFSLLSERFVIKNGLALTGIAALASLLLTRWLGQVHGRAVQHQRLHHFHAVPAGNGAALGAGPCTERGVAEEDGL